MIKYRKYGIVELFDNKLDGIYVSAKPAESPESTKYTIMFDAGGGAIGDLEGYILELFAGGGRIPVAYLLDDGTLEIAYADEPGSSRGTIVKAYLVRKAGYTKTTNPPWHGDRDSILHAVIDGSFAQSGVKKCAYWFRDCAALIDVEGFENLQGCTMMREMFNGCENLDTVYATEFMRIDREGEPGYLTAAE